MKKILLIALLFLTFDLFGASEVDSLKNELKHQSGAQKVETMLQIIQLTDIDDTASIQNYPQEIFEIAGKIQRPDLTARTYWVEAERLFAAAEYEEAIPVYKEAINRYTDLDSTQMVGEIYNTIGLAYYYLGEFDEALASQIEAVKSYESTEDLKNLTRIYINMGMVYNRLEDYKSAIEYYHKASVLASANDDLARLGNSYNGLGTGYYNQGQIDSAKVYYRKALKLFSQINNVSRLAAAINNLGNIYTEEKDSLEVGLAYYQKAYDIYVREGNVRNQVFVLEGLGCVYTELGNYEKAKQIFQEGLKSSVDHGYGYYIIQLYYEDLSRLYERSGDIKQALQAYKSYKTYLDSMRLEERSYQAAAIEKKYEFTKSEALISKLNSEKKLAMIQIEKDKAFRNLGVFAILILLVVITYVSFGNYHRKRINKLLTEKNIQIEAQRNELVQMNASKNKFFSIIAHDLKNPLHTVLGFSFLLQHDYDRFDDKDRKRFAVDIYNSTNNIFRLLQNLLDWSRIQTGVMKYEPTVFELSSQQDKICNLLQAVADQKNIQLNYEVPGDIFVYATPMMIDTVLRNLVSNAIKFTPKGGAVKLRFQFLEKFVACSVEDTGIGMTAEEMDQLFSIDSKIRKKGTNNEDGSGLGLILCQEFVQLNKGEIWAQSEVGKGTTFCFTVPLAEEQS